MTHHDEDSRRAARSAFLATGIAAAGAAALILLPKVRRALADTIDLAEDAAKRWYGAAEEVAEEFTSRTAGPREPEPEAQTSSEPEPAPAPTTKPKKATASKTRPKSGTTSSTSPGHVNPQDQTVVRRVGKSPSWRGQYTYELACGDCGHHYGANGPDIDRANGGEGRKCPECQDGKPGDPI